MTEILTSADTIDPQVHVYVYGSGRAGQVLANHLAAHGRRVVGFIDSFREGSVGGLPIRRLEDFVQQRAPTDVIVIASTFAAEIARSLRASGIVRFRDGSPLALALVEQERMAAYVEDGRVRLLAERT